MAGRKSLKEEIKIIERLTALSEPTFNFIKEQLANGDSKWAVEQMMKLYSKCIPTETDITSGGLPLILPSEVINKNALDIPQRPEADSTGHPPLQSS